MVEQSSSELYISNLLIAVESIPIRRIFIHDTLIPAMDRHRGRKKPAVQNDVIRKLYSVKKNKPGELVESMFEIIKSRSLLTTDKALDIAELIYYMEQPAGHPFLYGDPPYNYDHTLEMNEIIEAAFSVSLDQARAFCIAKYITRIRFNNLPEDARKQMEYMAVEPFLWLANPRRSHPSSRV
ncbi:MAG: hypothetical protein M3Q44_07590 [bacterium]|nr:hypothetical protein [bacterium]